MTNNPDKPTEATGRSKEDAPNLTPERGEGARIASAALEPHRVKESGKKRVESGKRKIATEIASFEQLIERAYKLKGRKIVLKPSQEKSVARALHLSEDSSQRLRDIAAGDTTFAVPRQLLLLARTVSSGSGLRASLRAFVEDRLRTHPLLDGPHFDALIRNLDDAPRPVTALAEISAAKRSDSTRSSFGPMKDAEFVRLKSNLTSCMAIWLADMKGLGLSEVAELLHLALWRLKAPSDSDKTARIRALTEIEDFAGVSVVCEIFQTVAKERETAAFAAIHEVAALMPRVESLQSQVAELNQERKHLTRTLEQERVRCEESLSKMREAAMNEATHLRYDFEILRTRIVRALKSDLSLLENGLEALRRPIPKVAVMEDVVERVADSLRREIENAEGDL